MVVFSWCVLVTHVLLESFPIPELPCPFKDMVEESMYICGGCLQAAAGWALLGVWRDKGVTHKQSKVLPPEAGTSYRNSIRKRDSGKI